MTAETWLSALQGLLQPSVILYLFAGIAIGTFIGALDLHIELSSGAVCRQNIQPHGAVQQVLHEHLRPDIHDLQIRILQYDLQNQLHAVGLSVEALREEVIIEEAKAPDALQVFLMLTIHNFSFRQKLSPAFFQLEY